MPGNKRVLVDDSSSDEEILYVLGKKTLKNMRMFLEAFSEEFWRVKDGDEPDEDDEAEIFLMKTLCTEPGELDIEKILKLLEDEKNHLPVMEALECLLSYDIDRKHVDSHVLSDEEVAELHRIAELLPKWGKGARDEREKRASASKKATSE